MRQWCRGVFYSGRKYVSILSNRSTGDTMLIIPASLSSSTFDVNATLILLAPHAPCAHLISALTRTTSTPTIPQPHTALNRGSRRTSNGPPMRPFQSRSSTSRSLSSSLSIRPLLCSSPPSSFRPLPSSTPARPSWHPRLLSTKLGNGTNIASSHFCQCHLSVLHTPRRRF